MKGPPGPLVSLQMFLYFCISQKPVQVLYELLLVRGWQDTLVFDIIQGAPGATGSIGPLGVNGSEVNLYVVHLTPLNYFNSIQQG